MSDESDDFKKQREVDFEMVKKAAFDLGEHFDSVRIFATRHDPARNDGTTRISYGVGNWFTSWGQINEWVIRETHNARLEAEEQRKEDSNE